MILTGKQEAIDHNERKQHNKASVKETDHRDEQENTRRSSTESCDGRT
jgi:hypothetical protein